MATQVIKKNLLAKQPDYRKYRIMALNMGKLIPLNDDWERASGLVICEKCGLELFDHPTCSNDYQIYIRCDGTFWKL